MKHLMVVNLLLTMGLIALTLYFNGNTYFQNSRSVVAAGPGPTENCEALAILPADDGNIAVDEGRMNRIMTELQELRFTIERNETDLSDEFPPDQNTSTNDQIKLDIESQLHNLVGKDSISSQELNFFYVSVAQLLPHEQTNYLRRLSEAVTQGQIIIHN
jgi:hypothetical protein